MEWYQFLILIISLPGFLWYFKSGLSKDIKNLNQEFKELKKGMNDFKTEVREEFREVRKELNDFKTEVREEFREVRKEVNEVKTMLNSLDRRVIRMEDRLEFSNKIVYIQHEKPVEEN